jgi:hypothetical protein
MLRFLLEAWDNLAAFTVLDRREALLKLFFAPEQSGRVRQALAAIREVVPLEVLPWPSQGDNGDPSRNRPQDSGPANVDEQGL